MLFNCLCIENYKSGTNKGDSEKKHSSALFGAKCKISQKLNHLIDIKVFTQQPMAAGFLAAYCCGKSSE